jgi:hypothetical protein
VKLNRLSAFLEKEDPYAALEINDVKHFETRVNENYLREFHRYLRDSPFHTISAIHATRLYKTNSGLQNIGYVSRSDFTTKWLDKDASLVLVPGMMFTGQAKNYNALAQNLQALSPHLAVSSWQRYCVDLREAHMRIFSVCRKEINPELLPLIAMQLLAQHESWTFTPQYEKASEKLDIVRGFYDECGNRL